MNGKPIDVHEDNQFCVNTAMMTKLINSTKLAPHQVYHWVQVFRAFINASIKAMINTLSRKTSRAALIYARIPSKEMCDWR